MDWMYTTRGVGIILIVIGNVARALVAGGIASGPFWQWMDYAIFTFHVPIFFLVAGFGLPVELKGGARHFLKEKAWLVVYPYFLWTFIQGGTCLLLPFLPVVPLEPSALLKILWQPLGPFWYLYALIVAQVAALFLRGRALAVAALLALAASCFFPNGDFVGKSLNGFFFFGAGALLSRNARAWGGGKNRLRVRAGGWAVAFLLALLFAASVYLSGLYGDMGRIVALKIPSTLLGLALTVWVSLLTERKTVQKPVLVCGMFSMSIYVMHVLVFSATRAAMQEIGVPLHPAPYFILCVATAILLPLVIREFLRRRDVLWIFGFCLRPVPGRDAPGKKPHPAMPLIDPSREMAANQAANR